MDNWTALVAFTIYNVLKNLSTTGKGKLRKKNPKNPECNWFAITVKDMIYLFQKGSKTHFELIYINLVVNRLLWFNDVKLMKITSLIILFVVPLTVMLKVTYRPKGSGDLNIVFICIKKYIIFCEKHMSL